MTASSIKLLSNTRSFNGNLTRYRHHSTTLKCPMGFAIYLPDQVKEKPLPLLYWLSGLTCTDENFMQKAGAHKIASELGIAIVCPDTSPRSTNLPGEHETYDLGSGAGFYVNATESPWDMHYHMYDYVTQELPELLAEHFPLNGKASISGHSMGGHGALVIGLRNPEKFASISAFAPISQPSQCPWGIKAFSHYLGEDRDTWQHYDAVHLINSSQCKLPILVDQGESDKFLSEQLKPQLLEQAAKQAGLSMTLRMQPGFDHSYYFIASFIEEHLRFHGKALGVL